MEIMVTGPDDLYPSDTGFDYVFEKSGFSLQQVTSICTGSSATGVDDSVSNWAKAREIEVSGSSTTIPGQNPKRFRPVVASAVDGVIIVKESEAPWEEEEAITKVANDKGVRCSVVSLDR